MFTIIYRKIPLAKLKFLIIFFRIAVQVTIIDKFYLILQDFLGIVYNIFTVITFVLSP